MDRENNLNNFSCNNSGEQLSLFLNLEVFEGPIDLLLHLSREQKVDLSSISISELASQYISFVEEIKILVHELKIKIEKISDIADLKLRELNQLMPQLIRSIQGPISKYFANS